MVDAAAIQARLRFRPVAPVVEPAADRERERGRHVDEYVPPVIRPAGLQYQHARGRIGGEAVGQGAAGRAAADNDEVVLRVSPLRPLRPLWLRHLTSPDRPASPASGWYQR